MKLEFAVLFVLAVAVSRTVAQCPSSVNMVHGTIYEIDSPGYPGFYTAGQNCDYSLTAPLGYKIQINCTILQNPCTDPLTIMLTGAPTASDPVVCSTNITVSGFSAANLLRLNLKATVGGRFSCTATTKFDPCACGRRNPSARIAGGSNAIVNEFTYIALLADLTNAVLGEAAILNPFWALTSDGAIGARTIADLKLVAGEHQRSITTETTYTAEYRITAITRNTGQTPTTDNLVLLRTDREIILNYGVGVICLPYTFLESRPIADELVTYTGWGQPTAAGAMADILQKITMRVVTAGCNSGKLCTAIENGKDICRGDAGSTAIYRYPTSNRDYAVGVVGADSSCNGGGTLSVAKVASQLGFITANANGAVFCAV